MRFDIFTLFPALFSAFFAESIIKRAMEAGLVNEVLEPEELPGRVAERAAALAALPPAAVRQTKELLRGELSGHLQNVIEREGTIFRERVASPEAAEAFAAFFEKRPADFSKFE